MVKLLELEANARGSVSDFAVRAAVRYVLRHATARATLEQGSVVGRRGMMT